MSTESFESYLSQIQDNGAIYYPVADNYLNEISNFVSHGLSNVTAEVHQTLDFIFNRAKEAVEADPKAELAYRHLGRVAAIKALTLPDESLLSTKISSYLDRLA